MRIDRLHIENFKKFERTEKPFEFHPHFTLLVGDNGSGKTSVLDALAVALGLWHKVAPGSGWRNILEDPSNSSARWRPDSFSTSIAHKNHGRGKRRLPGESALDADDPGRWHAHH
jgi:predicted ATP-dependent endonuclease of OLD family